MSNFVTTLNKIRAQVPCADGWEKLLRHLGKTGADDEPLDLATILDSNGLADAIWCMRAMPEHDSTWRLYAVWCARHVVHLMTDPRSIAALDVAERHACGQATDQELDAAYAAAAQAAAQANDAPGIAAKAAMWSVARLNGCIATYAADESAAAQAAQAVAQVVAQAVEVRADTRPSVLRNNAWKAAWDAARAEQEKRLQTILEGNE